MSPSTYHVVKRSCGSWHVCHCSTLQGQPASSIVLCLRGYPDRGAVDRLFLALAWQLAESVPKTRPYIESALQIEPLLYAKSINIQVNQLVGEVFEHLRDKPSLRPERSLVIIDGVDECATEKRHPCRCIRRKVCTQRRYPEILGRRILPNFHKGNISPLPSNEDIHHLVSKASGQFIYTSTVIKFNDDDDCNPKEQLDIILKLRTVNSSSPYAQLNQLYIQILSQQSDIKLLRDVFVLLIALGLPR